ncbi:class I SAM-dependent methyltransferase [Thermodesulfobacteriota bacterium]
MKDSKKLWLSIDKKMRPELIELGRYTTEAYKQDPIRLSFITSRYKFCARILTGKNTVLEIGCGDGFGSGIVAQMVGELICTDINEDLLNESRKKMAFIENMLFEYHDFREKPFNRVVDAIYLIDTIEHIYPHEEDAFMSNLNASLRGSGVCIIGTPNETADKFSSNWSREGHVNLKDYKSLMELSQRFFQNSFFFGMNDEIIHTGFPPMTHFMWSLCVGPKKV